MFTTFLISAAVLTAPDGAVASETTKTESYVFDVCGGTLLGRKGSRMGTMTLTREESADGVVTLTEKWNTKVRPTSTGRPLVGQFVPAQLFPLPLSAWRQSKRKDGVLIGYSGKTVVDGKTNYSFAMATNGRQIVATSYGVTTGKKGKRTGLPIAKYAITGPESLWMMLSDPKQDGHKLDFQMVAENLGNPMVGVKNRDARWSTTRAKVIYADGQSGSGYRVTSKIRWQSIHSGYIHSDFSSRGNIVKMTMVASKADPLVLWPRSTPSSSAVQAAGHESTQSTTK